MSIVFAPSPLYSYVRSLQLEGTFPEDAGCFAITAQRVAAGWGAIDDACWPNEAAQVEGWPPKEPAGLDEIAREARVPFYLRARRLHDFKLALSAGWPPSVVFDITAEWFDAPHGEVPTPGAGAQVVGQHCVCLVSHDDSSAKLGFANSWGTGWGNRGFGTVSYEYCERFVRDGWLSSIPRDLKHFEPYASKLPVLNWGTVTPLGLLHGVELYDPCEDVRRGWAFVRHTNTHLEVEELFVRPDQRGTGTGRRLCAEVRRLSEALGMPLRLWVPPVDDISDSQGVDTVARMLALTLRPSEVAWASRIGE